MSQPNPGDSCGSADTFTGYPWGRRVTAMESPCRMLDLTKLGRSSGRFPIAPDGYIPNSVIRRLYGPDPTDTAAIEPSSADRKPLRVRRRLHMGAGPQSAAAEGSQDEFVDVATRWDTWADEKVADAEPSPVPTESDTPEVRFNVAPSPAPGSPSPTPPVPSAVSPVSAAPVADAALEPSRRQPRRPVNTGSVSRPQPPSLQQLKQLRQQKQPLSQLRPKPSQQSARLEAVDLSEPLEEATRDLSSPPPPPQPAPRARAPPILKVIKKTETTRRPAAMKRTPPQESVEPVESESKPDDGPELQEGETVAIEVLEPADKAVEEVAEICDDQQGTALEDAMEQLPVIQVDPASNEESGEDEDSRGETLVVVGDSQDSLEESAQVEALEFKDPAPADSEDDDSGEEELHQTDGEEETDDFFPLQRAGDIGESLLAQIVAEPWFQQTDVPLSKKPVTRALLELMAAEFNSGEVHSQMCRRLVDIKRKLGLDAEFEQLLVSEITSQWDKLLVELADGESLSLRASPDSDEDPLPVCELTRRKAENLLDLLRDFGHEISDFHESWTAGVRAFELAAADANSRRRHRRRHNPDSGLGTEASDASDDGPAAVGWHQQPPLKALTEERLTTATSRASMAFLEDLTGELDAAEEAAVRFVPTPVAAPAGPPDEARLRLPPVSLSPRPKPMEAEVRELSVYDLMGDFRLKKLIQSLPKIEQMRLEAITERSRQMNLPYRCPRLVEHPSWTGQYSAPFSERYGPGYAPRPDATSYLPSWDSGGGGNLAAAGNRRRWRPRSYESLDSLETVDSFEEFQISLIQGPEASVRERRKRNRRRDIPRQGEEEQAKGVKFVPEVNQQLLRLPALVAPPSSARPSELWDGHCKMERLARHGMHQAGVPIARFLTREKDWC